MNAWEYYCQPSLRDFSDNLSCRATLSAKSQTAAYFALPTPQSAVRNSFRIAFQQDLVYLAMLQEDILTDFSRITRLRRTMISQGRTQS